MEQQPFDVNDLIVEYDSERHLVHVTASRPLSIATAEDGYAMSNWVKARLSGYFAERRGYMITDYTRISIEPSLIKVYIEEMGDIIRKFLLPNGIARYGLEITRITAKLGHEIEIGGNPNLFITKVEALEYIDSLIIKNVAAGAAK